MSSKPPRSDTANFAAQRLAVLAHELLAPTRFAYETAYRQKEVLTGDRLMPTTMRAKEVDDLLTTLEYIEALVDSISYATDLRHVAPSMRYSPEMVRIFDLVNHVNRICITFGRKYSRSPIELSVDIPTDLRLYIDHRAITQIFMNLITNSIKYSVSRSGSPPKIAFRSELLSASDVLTSTHLASENPHFLQNLDLESTELGLLVEVIDYGVGVAVSDSQKIFDHGYRSTERILPGIFGAGLGLPTVRELLRDHRADIWLENAKAPTCFAISSQIICLAVSTRARAFGKAWRKHEHQ